MLAPTAFLELRYVDAHQSAQQPLAHSFWAYIARVDSCVTRPAPGTVGHAVGDRLQVQWWTDPSDRFFAVQVLDTEASCQWEMFFVPARDDQVIGGGRMVWGTQAAVAQISSIWNAVFGPVLLHAIDSASVPTFVELLAAGSLPRGVTAVRAEQARLQNLQSDVEYWSLLARNQAEVLRKRPTAGTTWIPLPDADSISEPPPVRKAWRLREIEQWAAENGDRIAILPRAISSTRRSPYENEQFLYDCLELLATEYTQVKLGLADRFAFKRRADEMGLEYGGSVEPSVRGMYGDQYVIRWRGRKRVLDQHLSKGSARDPRYCMRIYFTWDEVEGRVVVGSMPAHLDTSGS